MIDVRIRNAIPISVTQEQTERVDLGLDGTQIIRGVDGHSPYIDGATGTWWTYNDVTRKYQDTGLTAGISIDKDSVAYTNSYDSLKNTPIISKTIGEWESDTTIYPTGTFLIYLDYAKQSTGNGKVSDFLRIKVADGDNTPENLGFTGDIFDKKDIILSHSLIIGNHSFNGEKDVYIPIYTGDYEKE